MLCLCTRLFNFCLVATAGKWLTSWLSLVVFNCEFVTFPLVYWVRCSTLLYRFLIFAPLRTPKILSVPFQFVGNRKTYLHDVYDFALDIWFDLYLQPLDDMI